MPHHEQLWSNSLYPAFAYVIAFVGSLLGLACTSRLHILGLARGKAWLGAGAVALGTGIWGMHFVAMLGYDVQGVSLHYAVAITVLSWVLAVVVVGLGIFVAGRDASWPALLAGGLLSGLGVAGMHYLGMRAIIMPGAMRYDAGTVLLSVVIAIVAATAALWATLRARGALFITGAALVMAFAISGMHYTGMAAVTATITDHSDPTTGVSASAFVLPLIAGLSLIVFVVAFAVLMNPTDEMPAPAPLPAEETPLPRKVTFPDWP
jgi:NO-binding membrane sensor protein with MHYT domain